MASIIRHRCLVRSTVVARREQSKRPFAIIKLSCKTKIFQQCSHQLAGTVTMSDQHVMWRQVRRMLKLQPPDIVSPQKDFCPAVRIIWGYVISLLPRGAPPHAGLRVKYGTILVLYDLPHHQTRARIMSPNTSPAAARSNLARKAKKAQNAACAMGKCNIGHGCKVEKYII